jgi:hypothetical protein
MEPVFLAGLESAIVRAFTVRAARGLCRPETLTDRGQKINKSLENTQ